jgi:hypothetical protein
MALIGPKKTPHDFGFTANDSHLIVNDETEKVKAFNSGGKLLWELPCLARGQLSDYEFKLTNSDTPPGLYKIGKVYRDYENDPSEVFTREKRSYGWYSFDLEGLEGQEGPGSIPYREGIMIHGGGTACGWPGAWQPLQHLYSTLGCIRMHNKHLKDYLLPLTGKGTVYVSVYQEG